jgi:hypothetical protein
MLRPEKQRKFWFIFDKICTHKDHENRVNTPLAQCDFLVVGDILAQAIHLCTLGNISVMWPKRVNLCTVEVNILSSFIS